MISLESVAPKQISPQVVERFFITTGNIPAGQPWQNTALPSIMQSLIFNFNTEGIKIEIPKENTAALSTDLVVGQHTHRFTTVLEGKIDAIGIHFTPTGLYRVLKQPMYFFADKILPLELHLSHYDSLKDQLAKVSRTDDRIEILESALSKNLLVDAHLLDAISKAADYIVQTKGSCSLADIGKQTGLSERTMQRYFLEYIGISPKTFARIARFNAVTRMIESATPLSWQDVLIETGYFDAAHFNHDFKNITGQTPSEYYKGKTAYEHFFYGS